MSEPGGTEADRAARERMAREARATAGALLDWVGTRVDGAATARADATSARPPQSAGPCTWCPVCALVAAVRGEQPELTAALAEHASGLLVVLRLLMQAHATGGQEHAAHDHPAHDHPAPEQPGPDRTAAEAVGPDVPWDVAPHALFDPDPRPAAAEPVLDDAVRSVPERPTGKRGPRPSPRRQTAGPPSPTEVDGVVAAAAAARPPSQPSPARAQPSPSQPSPSQPSPSQPSPSQPSPSQPSPSQPSPSQPSPSQSSPSQSSPLQPSPRKPPPARSPAASPTADRSTRGVQRIPVRRRRRPC